MMTRRFLQLSAALALGLAPFLAAHASEITVAYLHTDAQGSVVAETDEAGQVVERREYEPYGLPQEPMEGPGYTGHDHDKDSGLVYMQQRYYDPLSGRFLSVDPVGVSTSNGGNFNRYWYADNNPETFVDPDGRCTGSRITNGDGSCAFGGGNTTLSAPSLSGGTMSVQANANENSSYRGGRQSGGNSDYLDGSGGGTIYADSLVPRELVFDSDSSWATSLGQRQGESSAQYWADRQVETGNPLYALPGWAASLWTPDTALETSLTLGGGGSLNALKAFGSGATRLFGGTRETARAVCVAASLCTAQVGGAGKVTFGPSGQVIQHFRQVDRVRSGIKAQNADRFRVIMTKDP